MDLTKLKKPESQDILADDKEEEENPKKELLNAKKIMLSLRPSERAAFEILAEEWAMGLGPAIRHLMKKHNYI